MKESPIAGPGRAPFVGDTYAALMADALAGYVFDYDLASGIVARSDGFRTITGWQPDESQESAAWWLSLLHPDDAARYERDFRAELADPAVTQLSSEFRIRHHDGHWIWLAERARVIRDPAGRAVRVVGGANDVTARVEAERALAASEARYRALVEATVQFVWRRGAYGSSDPGTDAWWERLTGQPPDEANGAGGWGWLERLHPDDRARARAAWREAFANRTLLDLEYRIRARSGELRHYAVRGVPVGDPAAAEWIGTFTDVTEAREAEGRLREEVARRQQFVATVEQATDFIGIATTDGRAAYINPAARRLVGIPDDVPADHTRVIEYFTDAWQDRVASELLPILLAGGRWRGEVEFRHFRTGEAIPAEWNAFAVRDDATREVVALACVARDLREERAARLERERLLREAEAARREAETANRAKSEFLAVMSHELRTPLNAIAGYVDLIELGVRGPVNPQQLADLGRIRTAQLTLLRHINDVLNFAKLEAGHVPFDLRRVPVAELVASVEPLVAPQVDARHIDYACEPCDDGLFVVADPEKAIQVLLNLVVNAVKFTPPRGRVRVSVHADDSPWVSIRVSDTGIGIPAARLRDIFEPFVQVDPAVGRRHEGTGLGLAISRDLARGMGGELAVESTVGTGTTFTLRLPRA